MLVVTIVTINVLYDLTDWAARGALLVKGLKALQPDLIGLQEVALPKNTASWIARRIGTHPDEYSVHLRPKSGDYGLSEGIAILSRLPVFDHKSLELGEQGRVAQIVRAKSGSHVLSLINTHLFWQPGPSKKRQDQVDLILEWIQESGSDGPVVFLGDLNATPDTPSIAAIKSRFRSAYETVHGEEPEYTCPTPLQRSLIGQLWKMRHFLTLLRARYVTLGNWRGTLDYIFVSPQMNVVDCRVVLTEPATDNLKIYPSDHFGLMAKLELKAGI